MKKTDKAVTSDKAIRLASTALKLSEEQHLVIRLETQDNNRVRGRQAFLRAIVQAGRDYPETNVAKVLPDLRDSAYPIYSELALPVEHPIQQRSFLTCWQVLDAVVPGPADESVLAKLNCHFPEIEMSNVEFAAAELAPQFV